MPIGLHGELAWGTSIIIFDLRLHIHKGNQGHGHEASCYVD